MNLTGIKLAEALSRLKHRVTVVEKKQNLDLKFENEFSQNILAHLKGVEVKFGTEYSPNMAPNYDYVINCTTDNSCNFFQVK